MSYTEYKSSILWFYLLAFDNVNILIKNVFKLMDVTRGVVLLYLNTKNGIFLQINTCMSSHCDVSVS
jgi:hypothetical protein